MTASGIVILGIFITLIGICMLVLATWNISIILLLALACIVFGIVGITITLVRRKRA